MIFRMDVFFCYFFLGCGRDGAELAHVAHIGSRIMIPHSIAKEIDRSINKIGPKIRA